jgi:hypothetical protein
VHPFGGVILVSEIPFLLDVCSNPNGKNGGRQYLVGSFSGALSSQKVTEESIKVS